MTAADTPQLTTPRAPARPRHKRRWLRWTLIGVAAAILLVVGLIAVAVKLQPVPAPLALPANATAPVGPVNGAYRAASGSVAGFRIQQTVLGLTSEVVGRTSDLTGAVTIADDQVIAADLRAGLLALTTGDAKPAPQFGISLETQRYQDATIRLTQPVTLDQAFASGAAVSANATGTLTLHGVARTTTVALSLRRAGTSI
jgi:polyisoprenoid-binding protein YceI